jgi:hypothetical protein
MLPSTWNLAYNKVILHSGVRNPNNCRIPMTWWEPVLLAAVRGPGEQSSPGERVVTPCILTAAFRYACRFTCCCLHGQDTGDCSVVQEAFSLEHEMATHTMTHSEQ